MNRTTVVALVAAAVVGTLGGTVTAVVRDGSGTAGPGPSASRPAARPGSTPNPTPGRTPTPSAGSASASPLPSARTPSAAPTPSLEPDSFPLLYAGRGVIHDGARQVRYRVRADPSRLVRTRDGYLIAYAIDPADSDRGLRLAAVAPDGTTTKVADLRYWYFELDPTGTRVVGADLGTGRLRIWNLRGRVVAEAPKQEAVLLDPQLPPAPSTVADVPRRLDAPVLKALAVEPARRWPDVGSFVAALDAAAPEPVRGRPWLTVLLVLVVLAVTFVAAYVVVGLVSPSL